MTHYCPHAKCQTQHGDSWLPGHPIPCSPHLRTQSSPFCRWKNRELEVRRGQREDLKGQLTRSPQPQHHTDSDPKGGLCCTMCGARVADKESAPGLVTFLTQRMEGPQHVAGSQRGGGLPRRAPSQHSHPRPQQPQTLKLPWPLWEGGPMLSMNIQTTSTRRQREVSVAAGR